MPPEKDTPARAIGRYVLFREVAHGGMATVHLGRLRGPAGFARTVAIKRLHPQLARDPEFVSMFLDEARLAARIQHPNVVSVLDVVAAEGELFLVMDYVHGESVAKLIHLSRSAGVAVSSRVVAAIASNLLLGLHAAHEARNERGDPLGIVHRDVSPQNVLVGADGVARVLDFGIAKARDRAHSTTRDGQVKGKVPYMAPEQIERGQIDRRTDVYAASVMIWEALTGKRLFPKVDVVQLVQLIMTRDHPPPSTLSQGAPPELDEVVLKGLARDPAERWATAREMAVALERAWPHASAREVGEWVATVASEPLGQRAQSIAEIENASLPAAPAGSEPPRAMFAAVAAASDQDDSHSPPPLAGDDAPAGLPSKRRWRMVAAGAAAAVVVMVVGWLLATARGSHASSAVSPPGSAASLTSAATSLPPPQATASATFAVSDVSSTEPSASSAPPQPASTAGAAVTRAPARHHGPGVRHAGPRRSCDPPYTIDANGVRIPKRQCL